MNSFAVRRVGRFWVQSSMRFLSGMNDSTGPRSPADKEVLQTKRARLLYQSTKRGILENDLLLGGFFREHLHELTPSQLDSYDKLVNGGHNEWDIYYWITEATVTPAENETDVMQMLRKYALDSRRHYYHKSEQLKI